MTWDGNPSCAELNPMHWEQRRKGWGVVNKDKFIEYKHEQTKQQKDKDNRQRKKAYQIKRRSMADLAGKKGKIRKMSQRKLKWFYGGKQWEEKSSSDSNSKSKDDDVHAEVMTWLMDLDFNEYMDD